MLTDGCWKEKACAVIGGGPSLRNFNWEGSHLQDLLGGRIVAVNFAYEKFPQAACVITEDVRFIQLASRKESWRNFKGEKILSCLEPSYEPLARAAEPNIRIIPRKSSTKFWAKSLDEGLSYSSNSLVPALNIADILGADPIYILGLDCNPVEPDKPTNFHDHYKKAPGFERTNNHQLEEFRRDITFWVAPHLRHRTVFNMNRNTGVNAFNVIDLSYEEGISAIQKGLPLPILQKNKTTE